MSPFKGLAYFTEEDKDLFFGREKFTRDLLEKLEKTPFLALAGASGSGKSSLVHAGVIPEILKKEYLVFKFRPGNHPLHAASKCFLASESKATEEDLGNVGFLKLQIKNILKENPGKKIFILGDQFEELFTLTKDDLERRELGRGILELVNKYPDRVRIFITIRADFWTKLLEENSFATLIKNSDKENSKGEMVILNPMDDEELRSAIEKPFQYLNGDLKNSKIRKRSEDIRYEFQEGLVDLILTSVSNQPGSLPLLQFCLDELWKRQVDYTLTYSAYKEIGEVKGALATYADQVYENCTPREQEDLRKIMLQLVQPGQGTEDTRRVALVDEVSRFDSAHRPSSLSGVEGNGINFDGKGNDFIYKLTDLRLITTGRDKDGKQTVEVVHEALIREWGKLREWINGDREYLLWLGKLRAHLIEWEKEGKISGLLLQGTNLLTAKDWYEKRKEELGFREREYIEESIARERRKKIAYWTAGILVSSLILGFGFFGWIKNKEAKWEREQADAAKIKAEEAKRDAKEAEKKALEAKKDAEEAEERARIERERAEKEKEKSSISEKKAKESEEIAKKEKEKAEKTKKEIDKVEDNLEKALNIDLKQMALASNPNNWSPYQGKLPYKFALKLCKRKGMNLPEIGHWQIGSSKSIFSNWNQKGNYWIRSNIRNGKPSGFNTLNSTVSKFELNDKNYVRCIKRDK